MADSGLFNGLRRIQIKKILSAFNSSNGGLFYDDQDTIAQFPGFEKELIEKPWGPGFVSQRRGVALSDQNPIACYVRDRFAADSGP